MSTSSRCFRALRASLLAFAVLVLATLADSATVPASFAYVHSNGSANQVFAFRVGEDGALAALPGSPFGTNNTTSNCGGQCQTAAYSTKRRLLFSAGGGGLSVSRVATDGALTLVAGSPFGGARFLGVATVQLGASTFVYAAETDANQVRGFAVQVDDTLAEVPGSPFAAGMQLDGMTAARNLVFATSDAVPAVASFKVRSDGSLLAARGSPFPVGTGDAGTQNVFVEAMGRSVYVPDFDSFPIRVFGFRVNPRTAALSRIPGSPFPLALSSISGLAMRRATSLYAFGPPGDGIDVQHVTRKPTGALRAGPTGASGLTAVAAGGVDPFGRVVVLAGSTVSGPQAVSLLVGKKGVVTFAGMVPLTGAEANRINAVVFARP